MVRGRHGKPRPAFLVLDVSDPLPLDAALAMEIRGKEPLHRKSTVLTMTDRLRALPMDTGLRVSWRADDGHASQARNRAINRVIEACKKLRREARLAGVEAPVFTAYEGTGNSVLVFRGGVNSSEVPLGPRQQVA